MRLWWGSKSQHPVLPSWQFKGWCAGYEIWLLQVGELDLWKWQVRELGATLGRSEVGIVYQGRAIAMMYAGQFIATLPGEAD